MRRAFLVLWIGVLLLLMLSGMGWGESGDVPIADVLRGPYDVPAAIAVVIPPTADVLRGVYNVPVIAVAMPSTADVLRGVYDAPTVFAPMTFGVQPVPLADVLRGPYMPPLVAAPTSIPLDLVVIGMAGILLLIALGAEYFRHRHPPVAGSFHPPRPGHVH